MEIRRSKLIGSVTPFTFELKEMDPKIHFEGDEEFAWSNLKHSKKNYFTLFFVKRFPVNLRSNLHWKNRDDAKYRFFLIPQ